MAEQSSLKELLLDDGIHMTAEAHHITAEAVISHIMMLNAAAIE